MSDASEIRSDIIAFTKKWDLVVDLVRQRHDLQRKWLFTVHCSIARSFSGDQDSQLEIRISFSQKSNLQALAKTTNNNTAHYHHDFQQELCCHLLRFDRFYPLACRVFSSGTSSTVYYLVLRRVVFVVCIRFHAFADNVLPHLFCHEITRHVG